MFGPVLLVFDGHDKLAVALLANDFGVAPEHILLSLRYPAFDQDVFRVL